VAKTGRQKGIGWKSPGKSEEMGEKWNVARNQDEFEISSGIFPCMGALRRRTGNREGTKDRDDLTEMDQNMKKSRRKSKGLSPAVGWGRAKETDTSERSVIRFKEGKVENGLKSKGVCTVGQKKPRSLISRQRGIVLQWKKGKK